uniref:CHK kinase-like domain-containing protein n=1 Tax=Clastoptera arizonana TaxID=38151 RepID=A0A1B6E6E6_9HEMI
MTPTELEPILKRRNSAIGKVLKVKSEPAVAFGENYTSDIYRASVLIQETTGEVKTINVIIKCGVLKEYKQAIVSEMGLFETEIKMYTEILPRMEEILKKHLPGEEGFGPRCLGSRADDRIVLEDLKPEGYEMADRLKKLSLSQAKKVLQYLARFHAASYVLKEKGLLDVSQLKKFFLAEENYRYCNELFKANILEFSKVIDEFWGEEWKELSYRVQRLATEQLEKVAKACEVDESAFNVLNHGDLWVNNILFKSSENGSVQSIKFIDFQICHYNSPSIDLQYFFHTSIPLSCLKKNYDDLLETYYIELQDNLRTLNGARVDRFTLEDLKRDMEAKSYIGLSVVVLLAPYICGNGVEVEEGNKAAAMYRVEGVEECLKEALPEFLRRGLL